MARGNHGRQRHKNTGSGVKKLNPCIGGELVSPCCDQYFDNLNPDTGAVWQQVAEASIDDVNRAVLNSYETWNQGYRDSTVSERELWLKRAAEIIERDKYSIVDELCTEAGLPITQANREVESSIKVLYSIAAMATINPVLNQKCIYTMSMKEAARK